MPTHIWHTLIGLMSGWITNIHYFPLIYYHHPRDFRASQRDCAWSSAVELSRTTETRFTRTGDIFFMAVPLRFCERQGIGPERKLWPSGEMSASLNTIPTILGDDSINYYKGTNIPLLSDCKPVFRGGCKVVAKTRVRTLCSNPVCCVSENHIAKKNLHRDFLTTGRYYNGNNFIKCQPKNVRFFFVLRSA